ncbi:MAG: alpha-isopropylmalate synthase regulatory domain-containing protein [Cyanobacteria bacterium J06560_6]
MHPIQEQFKNLTISEIAAELGGFVLTPSVPIECLISEADPETFYKEAIQNITIRADDFFGLRTYMSVADKNIVLQDLERSVLGNCISEDSCRSVLAVLNSIRSLPFNREIERHAHEYSDKLALYNARRLLTALYHGASLVTCDPLEFTSCPHEQEYIRTFGYADICVGQSELDGELIDVKIWVFTPEALWNLMRTAEPQELNTVEKAEMLSLVDFSHSSDLSGCTGEVVLSLDGNILRGSATDQGAIDVLLRATERAVRRYIYLDKTNVHIHLSDTTANNDVVEIYLRLKIDGYRFEAIARGVNTLECSLRAYVEIINAVLKKWG